MGARFDQAKLRSVDMSGSTLGEARFVGASLVDVTLDGCTAEEIGSCLGLLEALPEDFGSSIPRCELMLIEKVIEPRSLAIRLDQIACLIEEIAAQALGAGSISPPCVISEIRCDDRVRVILEAAGGSEEMGGLLISALSKAISGDGDFGDSVKDALSALCSPIGEFQGERGARSRRVV